jgi:hypothetical protein
MILTTHICSKGIDKNMNAEAMRSDLEAFLNKALHEGRQGWPTKSGAEGQIQTLRTQKTQAAICRVPQVGTERALKADSY